ncbi:MAG: hypothetical protein IEMM0001_1139 [bacterium]|nr:MAG: hypothetical protein IEMM0001_1139 [bacterium]
MKRHYFISDSLDVLDNIEQRLEKRGIVRSQIHVLSGDDAGAENHDHLHNIESVLKFDVVHGTMLGTIAGFALAIVILAIGELTNLTATYTWTPFIFLAFVLFGFSTWFGGYHGIQIPYKDFRRFEDALCESKQVFFVEIDRDQERVLKEVTSKHPGLKKAGTGTTTPRRVVYGQDKTVNIATHTFP